MPALESVIKSDGDRVLLVAQRHDTGDSEPKVEDLYKVGVLARIDRHEGNADRGYQLVLTGLTRYHVSAYEEDLGFISAKGENFPRIFAMPIQTL